MSSKQRVVITGIGMVTPLGLDTTTTWQAILSSKSGVVPIEHFNASALPCQFAALVKGFILADCFSRAAQKMDAFIQYGLQAAREAILDAQLEQAGLLPSDRVGISMGSGIGGLAFIEQQYLNFYERGPKKVSPFFIPGTIINMLSGLLSVEYGCKGPNLSIVTACSTGTHNIGLGARLIAYGDADIMITGGAERASTPLSMAGFSACKALSTYNQNPKQASRPWDIKRDGFVLGDGAGVLILESYKHAKARGVPIYAELLGFGMSSDAHHITSPLPSGEGAGMAMHLALQDANLSPTAVHYINAHATSTSLGDIAEIKAIKRVFEDHAYKLSVSSTKSMTGHLLGAAGAIEAAFTALAIRDQIAPPTINLYHPDEGCDLNLVPHQSQPQFIRVALSNSFGFGGTNGSLLLGHL